MENTSRPAPHLPLSSMRLLVPPLRLMSASMWQVAQQRNVMQYGKLEEFVTLVTEMVPELLTFRQKAQLILGLRARLVLEVCHDVESNPAGYKTIQPYLERINSCAICKHSKDKAVKASQKAIVDLVQTLLEDPAKKEHFFQEVFPVHYSSKYDTALQILVWQFFDRLEKLLPVPSFVQTASYLSLTPTGLEECQQSISVWDPEHLNTLLQHHRSLGHVKNDLLFYDSDIILSTLSLPVPSLTSKLTPRGQEEGQVESERDVRVNGETNMSEGPEEQEDEGQQETSGEDEDARQQADTDRLEETGDSGQPSGDISGQATVKPLQSFSCTLCQFSGRWNSLQEHVQKNHLEGGTNRGFGEPGAGNNSMSVSETEMPSALTPWKKRYTCSLCGSAFKSLCDLKRHENVHSEDKPFHCDKCEKRYKNKIALKLHYRNHTGERPYVCSHCGKGFTSAGTLQSHVRTHTGEKPFVCSICGKGFRQTSILRVHLKIHGEKTCLCSVCGKTFYNSSYLKLHMRYHTGERPYSCDYCEKRFTNSGQLVLHHRTHTGERPYPCSLCDKRFSSCTDKKKHMRTHTGEKPFQCTMCDKRFSKSGNLKIHQRVHQQKNPRLQFSLCNISTARRKSQSTARKKDQRKKDKNPPFHIENVLQ